MDCYWMIVFGSIKGPYTDDQLDGLQYQWRASNRYYSIDTTEENNLIPRDLRARVRVC
jgi:hypothetical protein